MSDGTWKLHTQGASINLNPFALNLLGRNEESRDELMAEVEVSVEGEESGTPTRRTRAILQALEDQGIKEREIVKDGTSSVEVTWCLTLLDAERADPEQLLALVRNHWHIENRLHYVRDFTYDEDRRRAYVRHLPRNLACLTNAAIVRCKGRFQYLPEANRHDAVRAQDALDAILNPPTA